MKILVTGATGFVGGPVCRALMARGHSVVAAVRHDIVLAGIETRRVDALGPETDWSAALTGCDAVIHLAARAHVMAENEADPLALFRKANRDGTSRLAEQAAAAGIGRFVFVSSIKVNGEATPADRPFRADDPPAPGDAYGVAKAEAEAALAAITSRTGLSVTVIRPPLVHGPGAKGNLAAMMRILAKGWPLPLAMIDNRRSLVGVANLADAVAFLLERDAAGTFLVRDGEDVSTPGLLRRVAAGMGRRALLLPVPPALLRAAGAVLGKRAAIDRLLGSLVVDDGPLRALGWMPPVSLDAGLAAMAAAPNREPR